MKRLLALLLPVVVTGCAEIEKVVAPPAAPPLVETTRAAPASGTADQLLAYAARLKGMSEAALAAEAARERRGGTDISRIKAAMALSLSAQADEAEVISLVEPVAKRDAAEAALKGMASFLQVLAADRRRLRESAAASTARLRDERRAGEANRQRIEALQERAAQLQQKLDALTELEKSLSERQAQGR